jgi:hypothetical protein
VGVLARRQAARRPRRPGDRRLLTHEEQQLGYRESLAIGAIISAVQGIFALIDRWKRKRLPNT